VALGVALGVGHDVGLMLCLVLARGVALGSKS